MVTRPNQSFVNIEISKNRISILNTYNGITVDIDGTVKRVIIPKKSKISQEQEEAAHNDIRLYAYDPVRFFCRSLDYYDEIDWNEWLMIKHSSCNGRYSVYCILRLENGSLQYSIIEKEIFLMLVNNFDFIKESLHLKSSCYLRNAGIAEGIYNPFSDTELLLEIPLMRRRIIHTTMVNHENNMGYAIKGYDYVTRINRYNGDMIGHDSLRALHIDLALDSLLKEFTPNIRAGIIHIGIYMTTRIDADYSTNAEHYPLIEYYEILAANMRMMGYIPINEFKFEFKVLGIADTTTEV